MKQKTILIVIIFCVLFTAKAQITPTITGAINHIGNEKWVVLQQYYGVNNTPIGKSKVSKEGFFNIQFKDSISMPQGMYRLVYNLKKNYYIDFIYAGSNLTINFDVAKPFASVNFDTNTENTQYYNALRTIVSYERQLSAINSFVQDYKENKKLYNLAINEYKTILKKIEAVYKKANKNYTSLVNTYLIAQKKQYPNPKNNYIKQKNNSKEHLFDYLTTSEPLLNSPIINNRILAYIMQLRNEEGTTQKDYIFAVDTILKWSKHHEELTNSIITFLHQGFKMLDQPEIIEYIDVNYTSNQCEADSDTNLQERLAAYKRLAIGNLAPEISWQSTHGTHVDTQLLSQQKQNYTVVIFWGSWCEPCKVTLPAVNMFLKDRKDVFALAVGIDNNVEAWNTSLQQYPSFTHIQAPGKWKDKIVEDYAIYATPTFYVLDKDKKIIGKAKNIVELKALL